MYPTPILVPPGTYQIDVTAAEGGLAGVRLLGQSGPSLTAELSTDGGVTWADLTYPHTMADGESLRLTRTDDSLTLTTIYAVGSSTGSGFTVRRDTDGYLTTDSPLTRDGDGYLTTDTPLTRDADGYLSDGA